MKSSYNFIQHLFNQRNINFSDMNRWQINLVMVFFCLFALSFSTSKVHADTRFNVDDRNHLNIALRGGIDAYSYVDFRILAYDYAGTDDLMGWANFYFQETNGSWTHIIQLGTSVDNIHRTWNAANNANVGYVINGGLASSGDLRFSTFTWQFPPRLAGSAVRMRVAYEWDVDHNGMGRSGDQAGNYDSFVIYFPAFAPSISSSVFEPKPGGNVFFQFNKTAGSSPVNAIYLYSDAARSRLLSSFSIAIGANSGSTTFNWDNPFTAASTLYASYGLNVDNRNYRYNQNVGNSSYVKPSSLSQNYDNCAKSIYLSWVTNNNTGSSTVGQWVVERKEQSHSAYVEIGSTVGTAKSYTDNSCEYAKEYDYRVRFVPTGIDKTRILNEFMVGVKASTKRTVLNNLLLKSFTKTDAENPKVELTWNPNWCFNPSIIIQRKDMNTNIVTNLTVTSTGGTNVKVFTDRNLTENVPYQYRLVIVNEGMTNETAWQSTIIKNEVKYKTVAASKGTLSDRIQLKWNVERNDLSNSFFLKRRVFDERNKNPYEILTNITTNGKYYTYDDRDIEPGVLYEYKVGSEFTLPNGKIDSVSYNNDIIGFAQASGTVSGRITFGSGTSVDSVSVFASNANESESLYRSMSFNGAAGGGGGIALTPEKHACVKSSFTWQAWLLSLEATANMAVYESNKEFSVRYENSRLTVYFYHVNATSPLISYDMKTYPTNEFFHTTVSFDGTNIKLYVNAELVNTKALNTTEIAKLKCENTTLPANSTIAYLGDGFSKKGPFKGNVDDLRLWDYALSQKEVALNYNRYINGNENGLIGYWQFDEGLNKYAFDKSNYKKNYNEHHINFTSAQSSTVVPTLDQLSIKGMTDKNGNFLITGIPFMGEGSTYSFTPSRLSHEFEPSQLNRHLTYQTSVHNAVDFKDVSSFPVRIKTTYENTTFPSDSVSVLVDGDYVYKDKNIISTNANGECIIEVPIGKHSITVERRGHNFISPDGKSSSITMNFTEPILGSPIQFLDQTKVTIAGRVVGGVMQASKSLGFGLSKANIGEAIITMLVPDGDYQLNTTGATIGVPGAIGDVIGSETTIAARSKTITIKTDPKTGEFRLLVPPLKYKVTNVTTRGGLTGKDFQLSEFQVDPNILLNDTATINKKRKQFDFHQRLDFTYRVDKITIDVIDPLMPAGVFGDSIFNYEDLTQNKTVRIPMYNFKNNNASTPAYDVNNKAVYKYGYPIYQTTHIYNLRVSAYEQYSHPDNLPEMAEFCKVPASNADIVIQNEMGRYELPLGSTGNPSTDEGGASIKDYSFNNEGIFDYVFKAGFPNLVTPYTLGLKIEVEYEGRKSSWERNAGVNAFKAIVMGDILTGTDFVTSGPDLISFVLRDPPGSNSYSYMEKGTTVSNSYSYSKSYVSSLNIMGTLNYGQKASFVIGIGVAKIEELEIKNQTGVGVAVEQSKGNGSEFSISTTTTERIETSSSPDYVGRRGDIYVGTSTNLFFGNSRRLSPVIVGGNYELRVKDEMVGDMSAETNFKYTYAHITESLIPSLIKLRNDLIETVADTESAIAYTSKSRYVTKLQPGDDNFGTEGTYRFIVASVKTDDAYTNAVLKYNTSIDGWGTELAKNEDEKIQAMDSKLITHEKSNISADAGVTTERSVSICGSSNLSSTSSYNAQAVIKTENGFQYNGLGFQFELETKQGAESETVNSVGEEYCTTYGYVIADENPGDYLSIDVYTPTIMSRLVSNPLNPDENNLVKSVFDTYSGAPIFVTRGGRTSCPYEPLDEVEYSKENMGKALGVATLQVEKPDLKVVNPFATDIPSGKEATYKIILSNLSESNTAGWYMLTVDEKTNSKGAIITVDGQTLGNGKLYLVVPNEPMEKIIKLKQSSIDELDYSNIGLELSSTCDDISSSISISAQFVPSCSDVTLEITNKIVNTSTSDILPITIKDYNRDYKNFGGILLQYKTINEDESGWSTIRKFVYDETILAPDQNSEIITKASIDYKHSMKGKDDQTYQFRALTVCRFGTELVNNQSEVITVKKDMVTPTSLGNPSPSNGILTPESEISITFNENIQIGALNSTNFKAEAVMNGYTLKHNTGLNFDGSSEAYTESQFNLQAVPVSVEAWIRYSEVNTNATLFAIGEGANQLKLQLNGNTLKAFAGAEEFTGNINADANWQYLSLGYNPQSKQLTVKVNGQMNDNKKVIDKKVISTIEPSARLYVGTAFNGNMSDLSLWIKERDFEDMAADRNVSKSGRESGLIGYWPMDEGTGKLATDKVNSRNLTVKGGWYIERMGKAIQMNGIEQNVLISTGAIPVKPTEDYSVEFWFKTAAQTNTTMFSCGKGIGDIDASNKLSVGFDGNASLSIYSKGNVHVIPAGNTQDNQWHHFSLSVLRNGNTNVMIDGVSKYQTSSSKFGSLAGGNMSLGARYYKTDDGTLNYTTDQYFAGSIDELRIWKGALTAENVRLDLQNQLQGNETGLLAYYPFEEYSLSNASQLVISNSLKDAMIPTLGMISGGLAVGTATFTDNTPAMKEARPKEDVYFNWTATDNKILVNVLEPLSRIENCILEFTVDRVLDLNGNRMSEPKKWTVYVDNNRLKWATESQKVTKEVLDPLTFTANIVNNSGKYENYVIDGLPTWLSVNKSSGKINPLEKQELKFTVDPATNIGSYETRITLTGNNNIQEMLPIALKVTGTKPNWSVNPHDYATSMSITGQVKIEGVFQEDTEDLLAAFIGNRCVGVTNPVFNKLYNSYIVYMDVYGLEEDESQSVKFSLWDAGTGRIYPDVDVIGTTISFIPNAIIGRVTDTKIFNATDKIEQQLTLKQGWNWFSTNVLNSNPNLLNQFKASIENSGVQIKARNSEFINYSSNLWSGTLMALNQTSMYMVKTNANKIVKLTGAMAKPADETSRISINPQWSWIGYTPQFVAPVKEALSNLTVSEGDQIKGQVGFASYTSGAWNGSLQYLTPGLGYMYYSANSTSSSFLYPSQYLGSLRVARVAGKEQKAHWTVDVNKYQMSMTVTSVALMNYYEIANTDFELAVFIDNECRGNITLQYVESYNRYMAFIMIWGNPSDFNKKITVKGYNSSNDQELTSVDESILFIPDNIIGTPANPHRVSFISTGLDLVNNKNLKLYPNPVNDILHVNYDAAGIEQIAIYDNLGRRLGNYVELNKNTLNVSNLLPGVYTIRVKYQGQSQIHKFIRK